MKYYFNNEIIFENRDTFITIIHSNMNRLNITMNTLQNILCFTVGTSTIYDLWLMNKKFSVFINVSLTEINTNKYKKLTDIILSTLSKSLISLDLGSNNTITDDGVKGLTRLTSLNLCHNNIITDDGIKGLTQLTSLNLCWNKVITNDGVRG